MIEKIVVWIQYLLKGRKYRGKLPQISNMKNPKMHYEILSDSVYWEDEGLEELPFELTSAMKYVIHYRTHLITNPDPKDIKGNMKKYKQVYERVKKNCPGWIGFQEKRCSYDSELADRIRRIRKVSEWKIEKAFQEVDEYDERISK